MLSIIAIIGNNNAIGYKNKLLWNIPDDMKHFKEITNGHAVIMGRKTFESIGCPLPDRTNIIITRDQQYKADSCFVVHSLVDAINLAKQNQDDEIFVIGGGQIYQQALPYADKLYLTIVDDEPRNADTFFPDYSEFKNMISKEEKEYNGIKYKFIELTK